MDNGSSKIYFYTLRDKGKLVEFWFHLCWLSTEGFDSAEFHGNYYMEDDINPARMMSWKIWSGTCSYSRKHWNPALWLCMGRGRYSDGPLQVKFSAYEKALLGWMQLIFKLPNLWSLWGGDCASSCHAIKESTVSIPISPSKSLMSTLLDHYALLEWVSLGACLF